MERLSKVVSFTLEEWRNLKLKKDDLVWVSDQQMYVEDAIQARERGDPNPPPFEVSCTMCIVEEIWIRPEGDVFGVIVHDIIRGERGSFGVSPGEVIRNITQDNQKLFSASRIQRRFRTYIKRKRQVEWALRVVQPVARAWYVSPNNPSHQKRMRAIAEKWGMCY